jgi:hypothetical protein
MLARSDFSLANLFTLVDDPEIVKKLKDAGYDGAIMKEDAKRNSFAVFSPDQIKTKSQLLDIYKKAHGK